MFRSPILAGCAFLVALAIPAQAQQDATATPQIVVTGQGEVAVAPDMAILILAVATRADTAREALDENNATMDRVAAALREAGIEGRDLQTSGLAINPRYDYPRSDNGDQQEQRLVGYDVTNQLTVRVREVASVGAILDEAVTLGVNQGGSISFVNDDPAAALDRARTAAIGDAMNRAETLAEAAGVELGDIVKITESADAPPPMPLGARAMRMEASDTSVPVEAGENSYSVSVDMTFEIAR